MKYFLTTAVLGVFLVGLTATAMPDDRISEIWECKLKDGKTIEAVHAANSKWVKFMNSNVAGGDIQSYVLTPQVGEREEGSFMYLDSYPSLESWAAGDKAMETTEGKAIEAELNAAADCSENSLHKSRQS